jgi:hypothetical protein
MPIEKALSSFYELDNELLVTFNAKNNSGQPFIEFL